MNVLVFGMKRAFQSTLRVTRRAVASFGLTAARFDMLHMIQTSSLGRITQSDLRRGLGVTAPTVSRMLRSLEELGLVKRYRPKIYGDSRQRVVSLTAAGLLCIRRAFKYLVAGGAVTLALDTALTMGKIHSPNTCFMETSTADSIFDRIRKGFRDTATLYYPWHPDD